LINQLPLAPYKAGAPRINVVLAQMQRSPLCAITMIMSPPKIGEHVLMVHQRQMHHT